MIQCSSITIKWQDPQYSVLLLYIHFRHQKQFFPRIYFRFKITDIENKYYLYSRTYKDGSFILDGFESTASYSPVAGIISLRIVIAIVSAEGLIIFILGISKSFQNTILLNPEEIFILVYHISTWNDSK